MSAPGTITWFARHELRLVWRDWISMMTAGRRGRARTLIVALVLFALFMHAVAYGVVSRFAGLASADKTALVVITVTMVLSWALMMSQAMESVTRAFYARSDLDLLLSSPASAERIFSVRLLAIAFSVMAMSALIAAPFINVLAFEGGVHWLAAYGAMAASGIAAAAIGALVTTALFEMIGAKRTRLVAQIVAAVIGAGFVIALQLAAILSTGTLSRLTLLTSAPIIAIAPDSGSAAWWPARAMLGDPRALAAVAAASFVLLGASILLVAPRFARCAIASSGIAGTRRKQRQRVAAFRTASPLATLRRKEWALLWRDPWLISQSLMQLLYLLPPAFLLWRSFGDGPGATVLLVPILVMAAGQLAGGLAWLAISGEDAPELIATAPLTPRENLRAKIEAVMAAITAVFAPLLLGLALQSVFAAVVAAVGIAGAAASATYVQLLFRAQAKRSQFRRRQVSSRVATFAEAFVSIGCAATAALAASGMWAAVLPATLTIGIIAGARAISPRAV
jgi:ABC-2 type transport system permease protein